MKYRKDGDAMRNKTNYWDRSKANRDEYDNGINKAREMKEGMDTSKPGAAGAYCGV